MIYKNPALSVHIKKPSRNGNIFKFISDNNRDPAAFAETLPGYAVIEYAEGTGLNAVRHVWRALVFEEKVCCCDNALIWLFPRRILRTGGEQVRALLPFYTERLGTLCAMLRFMCETEPGKYEKNLPFSRSPESAYDTISQVSSSERSSEIRESPTDLAYFLKMFGDYTAHQLGLRGFRFELSNHGNVRTGDALTIAVTELASLYAQLVYASLIISGGHLLVWDYGYTEHKLTLEFTAPYPQIKAGANNASNDHANTGGINISGSIYDAALHNPEIAVELFFCDMLWNTPGRRVIWESSPTSSVLRVEYTLDSPKFIMLRKEDKLLKKQLMDKMLELTSLFDS